MVEIKTEQDQDIKTIGERDRGRKTGRQEGKGRKCFIERRTQHILFTVIWCQTYGKGPLR